MLENIKTLLGLSEDEKDELIKTLIGITSARLCVLAEVKKVPRELEHIVTEVTVARYNRIGSEGLASHSVEGENMSWSDNDFAQFLCEIEIYTASQESPGKGRVKFI